MHSASGYSLKDREQRETQSNDEEFLIFIIISCIKDIANSLNCNPVLYSILYIMHYALCIMHYALCIMHYAAFLKTRQNGRF